MTTDTVPTTVATGKVGPGNVATGQAGTVRPVTATADEDSIRFQPSAGPTIGLELELQIVDPETGDLVPGSVRILKACKEEGLSNVTAELMQSMIEVKTGICQNVAEAKKELDPLLRRVRNIAQSLGYQLAFGGTHPFARGLSNTVFPAERYERIQERLAWLTYQRVVFGLHVHVGMPSGDVALGVISSLVSYLPHLLAVSACSPFWRGEDTGLASCRSVLYRMLPHSGVPSYFHSWKDFRSYYRVMKDTRAIQSSKDLYWDIRPCPGFGTIEFRVCDMPLSLSTVYGVTALIHCLAISAERLLKERPQLRRGDIRKHWIAVENLWLAARYGLDAVNIRTPSGKRRLLTQDLAEVIDRVKPIAEETGDYALLRKISPERMNDTGAAHLRQLYRDSGEWRSVIQAMTQTWAKELPVAGAV